MARLPRLALPGIPQHIVQRGNNRLPCFLDSDDRQRYLHLLRKALLATGCQLHAYVLMDNHVHLLATPTATGAVARMMQAMGRTMWRYSTLAMDALGRCGKDGISLVSSIPVAMSSPATATSNSTRCGPDGGKP